MGHYNLCPLCGSSNVGPHIQTNDFFLSGEPFSLFRCFNCGFVFTQDHPDEKTIGRYYASEEYLSHNDSAKGIIGSLYRISRDFMLKRKRRLVETEKGFKRGRLLDIGSGTGHFLHLMKQAGWEIKGIEINEKARKFAVSSLGLDVISPDKISFLLSRSYECITLWHVLEHFEDPFRYLSEISRLLADGGICIIALPNSNSFDAEHYKKFWAAYDVPRHIWHFSPFTFQLFAQKTGFKIRTIKSLPLDVFYISILSEKYMGTRLYFIAGFIIGKWYWFLSIFKREKSSSLIYILSKKEN